MRREQFDWHVSMFCGSRGSFESVPTVELEGRKYVADRNI